MFGLIMLLPFMSQTDRPGPLEIVVAVILAFFLFPRSGLRDARQALRQSSDERQLAVTKAVTAGSVRRILPAYYKHLRKKVAAGQSAIPAILAELGAMEREARGDAGDEQHRGAFTNFLSRRLWRRAMFMAAVGTAIGLPWTLLAVAGAVNGQGEQADYLPLQWLARFGPLLLTWPAIGFYFGYFFPLLRGRNGLQKGLFLSTAIIVTDMPTSCSGAMQTGGPKDCGR